MIKESIEDIKKLRELTGAGVMDAKKALADAGGDLEKAADIIRQAGLAKAEKRSGRDTTCGLVYSYIHRDGEIGVLVELNCETSFVAKTDDFRKLAHEIALQIASMEPESIEKLLEQTSIRDSKLSITDMIKAVIAKTGENISIRRFSRYQLGQE